MSALLKSRSTSLAGLTLDAVLSGENAVPTLEQSPPLTQQQSLVTQRNSQTLLDIISDEFHKEEHHKERPTWKIFRDKLRLKRTGSAWTSSLHIPTSDIFISDSKRGAFGVASIKETVNIRDLISSIPMSDPPASSGRAMFTRGSSMRVGSTKNLDDIDASIPGDGPPSRSFKPQLSRHDSVRDHGDGEDDSRRRNAVVTFVEERTLSARQAVAAQEAAEAEAAAAAADDDDDEDDDDESGEEEEESAAAPKPVTMSLMDEEEGDGDGDRVGELSCCACMVKIKSTATTPCGHAFCKLCSKELAVQKGHCPVCSSFVLEFLEIF